ncbi:hypothetical protein [Haloferax sp. KTX1]|uniref:hypothetical protein n=1 Tax=Haloferax sp. KTX1 TaxID=2600597 RepID=UPI0011DD256D|nr:hypothetical protein [Haloferax sp. KTX1]
MFDDTHTGRDDVRETLPRRYRTLSEAALVAVAAVGGVFTSGITATLVAPLAPGLGLVALFVGWPVGFVAGLVGVRGVVRVASAGRGVVRARLGHVRSPSRDAVARGGDDAEATHSECPAATDGGFDGRFGETR